MINDKIVLAYRKENTRFLEFIKICKINKNEITFFDKIIDDIVFIINLEEKVLNSLNIKIPHDHQIDHKKILSFISSAKKRHQRKELSCIENFNFIEQLYIKHDLKYGNQIFQKMSEKVRGHHRSRSACASGLK